MRQFLGRDTWAGILNDDLGIALVLACTQRYAFALGRVLKSIVEQISNDLQQAVAVRADRANTRTDLTIQRDVSLLCG